MALRFQAARRIDRQAPALRRLAFERDAPALAARRQAHRLVFDQLGDGEAVMRFDEGEIVERHAGLRQRARPRLLAAFEQQDVALRHRQEILDVLVGAEGDGAAHRQRRAGVGEHDRGGAVGNQRAVGALQRAGNERVLLAFLAAEIEAEILAHLRIGIVDAVLVVLGGDGGERIRLVAMALEIALRDLAEHAGETGRRVAILGKIGGAQQVLADLRAGRRRHLLGADHQHDARGVRVDGADALPDRRRAGRAGILDARRRLEAQAVVGLQHQARGEILGGEAGVEMAEHDLVDIVGADAGMFHAHRPRP